MSPHDTRSDDWYRYEHELYATFSPARQRSAMTTRWYIRVKLECAAVCKSRRGQAAQTHCSKHTDGRLPVKRSSVEKHCVTLRRFCLFTLDPLPLGEAPLATANSTAEKPLQTLNHRITAEAGVTPKMVSRLTVC